MKRIMEVISYLALAVLVAAPLLFYMGTVTLELNKTLMLIATVVWFVGALCWMGREKES